MTNATEMRPPFARLVYRAAPPADASRGAGACAGPGAAPSQAGAAGTV